LRDLRKWFEATPPGGHGGILCLPTGAGKTFTAVRFLCTGPLSQDYKILWLAHTHHLLDQAFYDFGPKAGGGKTKGSMYAAEVGGIAESRTSPRLTARVVSGAGHFGVADIKPTDDVVVCTLQTATRAFAIGDRFLEAFLKSAKGKLLVVFDEAHHAPAPSYRKFIMDLRKRFPHMFLLGLTATPTYSDEKRAGWLRKLFPQGIIHQAQEEKLIAAGVLARPVPEPPQQTEVTPDFPEREFQKWIATYRDIPEDIISQLAENQGRNDRIAQHYVANRKHYGKTIIFADRWHQCDYLRECLLKRKVRADVVYSHIDADPGSVEARNKRDKDENGRVLERFRNDELDVVINVRMLTEGTDVPKVQTVFLTRQTTSPILLKQMVGRALRGPAFGGTDTAYIVPFIDNWQQAIAWAEYGGLEDGGLDESLVEYAKRPPLHLISIDLLRQLAQQMDTGVNVCPVEFTSLLPVGWYAVEYQAVVAGTEDIETVRRLVLVYDGDAKEYRALVLGLSRGRLDRFRSELATLDDELGQVERWKGEYFPAAREHIGTALEQGIFDIARHIAESGQEPAFHRFEERDHYDVDRLAETIIDDKLDATAEYEMLSSEYDSQERYWRVLYYRFEQFQSQVDACKHRIIAVRRNGGVSTAVVQPGKPECTRPRGPSPEVQDQVKKRDGRRCLCCGSGYRLQVDHIWSFRNGGPSELHNLQTLCQRCNGEKGTNELNFVRRVTGRQEPLPELPSHRIPQESRALDEKTIHGWVEFLRGCINKFYECGAVAEVSIRVRGPNRRHWEVELWEHNNPQWLKPHLPSLIQTVRARFPDIEQITVHAPGGKSATSKSRGTKR
jgi:superfamily II DNA or RNA helicase